MTDEVTVEIEQEVYDRLARALTPHGVTVEEMAAAFLEFATFPGNLPLIRAYLGPERRDRDVYELVVRKVLEIAKEAKK